LIGGVLVSGVALALWVSLPLPSNLLKQDASSIRIEDRHGLVLRSTRAKDGTDATWVSFADIDPDLINAFVATEDRRFWDHHGIDVRAAARAAWNNITAQRTTSGASTLTMQLARLVSGHNRSWSGKVAQALWAIRLDAHLTKQEILEQYLNRIHLGQNVVGVAAASRTYFGASASQLSIGQAATLAGIAHAPSRDNPYSSAPRARARREVALSRMRRMGFITKGDAQQALLEPVGIGARRPPFLAPHFTTRVFASSPTTAVVRTSLDADLQARVEDEVRHTVSTLKDEGVAQAAAVVLDNATGQVLAWVGSPDFWAERNGQTDMVVSQRQPGSALKPFLYALAIERGMTAATVLPDIPRSFATPTGPYSPRNYDRHFRGPVRVREALASSYNVPAVEVAEQVSAASFLATLHLAGFASLDKDANFYGLGLALGNGDVTLIELANGYRALANGGEWRPWTWQRDVRVDSTPHRIVSQLTSAIVLDILADPSARMPGFGAVTPFDFPFPVAVKTGTSRHFTDNWSVGTTRNFTVAVWAGNFTGKPMQGVSGVTGAGPLLHRVVMATAERYQPGALITPAEAGAVPAAVCRLSGLRATEKCAKITEWFKPGSEPSRLDDWERGGRTVLPSIYATWSAAGTETSEDEEPATQSTDDSELTLAERLRGVRARPAQTGFRILAPLDGDRYSVRPGSDPRFATIGLRASAGDVEWIVDGIPHEGVRWTLTRGLHTIEARAADGRTAAVRVIVE
jgi:penicillin-binding protein 1C